MKLGECLRRGTWRTAKVLGSGLLLVVILLALAAVPSHGRWEIPYHSPALDVAEDSEADAVQRASRPTATPVPLPEQADVPILMYHYVSDLPANSDQYRRDLTVSPEAFDAQLAFLEEAEYHPITLTDLYLYLTEGYPLPENPIALTFDDGYRDAHEVVFPRLLEYGFPATFFVLATPAHQESAAYLTWAQMREMSDAGMDIQAHGRDHVDLRGRSYDFLVYQILGIKEAIEYHTDRAPRFFCYPSGRWDADVVDVLASAGYWGAVTTEWGKMHTRAGLFTMPRLRVRGGMTLDDFAAIVEGQ